MKLKKKKKKKQKKKESTIKNNQIDNIKNKDKIFKK